ncbi:heme NO-binding domain-containing protein [Thermonema rossianum]|jgi:hypothetical protein|uniref:heme NO-binding domain-containing protein n=1 Tax=Thermonema rossianum TaxID=55505 RepID=UPI00056E6873|nr:heme NO-binding domain-containing protein [Thermonema rossianum]
MKGTILTCLEETIAKKYGQANWQEVLRRCDLPATHHFALEIDKDIDEQLSVQLFVKSAEVCGVSLQQIFDDFGEYWCLHYAPKVYKALFIGPKSTKDFITKLDFIHDIVTKRIPNAHPPRFQYRWESDNVLLLHYQSSRGLIDLLISLIKGLDKYFNNHTSVEKIDNEHLRLTFHEQ